MRKIRKVKHDFAIHEAAALTGFSKHMLDYLHREHIYEPSIPEAGRGRARKYAFVDIVCLRALFQVCIKRGKIAHLKQAFSALRDQIGSLKPGDQIAEHLFVFGDQLCLRRTPKEVAAELLNGQLVFDFSVDLNAVTHEISSSIKVDLPTGGFRLTLEAEERAQAWKRKIWEPIKARREERRATSA